MRGGHRPQLRMSQQDARRWKKVAEDRGIMIDALKAQVRKLELGEYHQEPKRRRKRIGMRCANFTLNGHYRMAIRSRHSYGGSRSSLQMLALGTVRQVLDKWELLLGANIRAQTIAHHHSFLRILRILQTLLVCDARGHSTRVDNMEHHQDKKRRDKYPRFPAIQGAPR